MNSVLRIAAMSLAALPSGAMAAHEMTRATPVRLQTTIGSGHTPFSTRPEALAVGIEDAAK